MNQTDVVVTIAANKRFCAMQPLRYIKPLPPSKGVCRLGLQHTIGYQPQIGVKRGLIERVAVRMAPHMAERVAW